MQLRPYQANGINQIREHFGNGTKKVLFHLATGGGKTICFCEILKGVQRKGKRAMMVVRGKKLVDQGSARLQRDGVEHGVIMAGHWRSRPNESIQVCSIDTLYARRDKQKLPHFDLIVIDEAHLASGASYKWLIDQYPDAFFLPVTATPHLKQGMRHIADVVVYPITMKELIEQGFLVAAEYYAPSRPDLSGVGIDSKTGDYKLSELSKAMEIPNLYGDMIASYKKFAYGLPTLLFCVSVEHSRQVCLEFNNLGIPTEHLDANSSDKERNEVIDRLINGTTKVLTNVGILTTGVDIPAVQCIMIARPTKSYNLYVQILGRGTRPYPGKKKFIVLDHGDCVIEHGFIENERTCNLDGEQIVVKPKIKTCLVCYFIWEGPESKCPNCGHVKEPEDKGELVKRKFITDETCELQKLDAESLVKMQIEKLVDQAVRRGYKVGWIFFKMKDRKRMGEEFAKKYFGYAKKIYREKMNESSRMANVEIEGTRIFGCSDSNGSEPMENEISTVGGEDRTSSLGF